MRLVEQFVDMSRAYAGVLMHIGHRFLSSESWWDAMQNVSRDDPKSVRLVRVIRSELLLRFLEICLRRIFLRRTR